MNILGVKARNFRSYQLLEVLFAEKNLVVAPNGSGKSSIVDAIAYGLTGVCRGTDEGGKGADSLLAFHWLTEDGGAPPIAGAVEVATDKGKFRRGIGDGPNSKVGVDIRERLGFRPEALRAVFRPGSFLALPRQDQAELWSALSAPPDISPIAAEHLKDLVAEDAYPKTIKQLENMTAVLTEKRPILKRQIQEAERASTVDLSAFDTRLVGMATEDLEATKEGLEKRLKELRADRDKVLVTASKAPAPAAPRVVSKHEATIMEYETMLKSFPGVKRRCPHCEKGVVLLEDSKELQTVDGAREAEKSLRMLLDQTRQQMARETKDREPEQVPLAPAEPPATAALDEKIEKATRVISDIDRLLFIRQQNAGKAGRVATLKAELERMEKTIAAIGPKGALRAALTNNANAAGFDLLQSVNRVLKAMGRPEAWVCPNPWIVTMGRVPAVCLSDSQRLALNIAIQTGIAEATGIRVLVVDGIEMFESSSRAALSTAIRDVAPFVDQVFLLGAKAEAELDGISGPPGWKLIRVRQNGHGVSEVV